jgi:hypothetical protein
MGFGVTEVVFLGGLLGLSALMLLVVLPWLVLSWVGFQGCLHCGSELNNGAGKCLMCGTSLRQQRSLVDVLIQRLTRSGEQPMPEPAVVVQLLARHSSESKAHRRSGAAPDVKNAPEPQARFVPMQEPSRSVGT